MYNFDVNSTNNFFIFFSLPCTRQHSIIEHDFSSRAKPSSPFYLFLLERIRRVGGGEEGKVEIRRIGRARVKSSRRFELFRGGCFERYWRAQVRAERSAADNEEMEEASRRGDEKRRRRTCSARMSAGDVCPRPADPSDLDVTSSISSREIPIVLMQRRGNKNSIFLG